MIKIYSGDKEIYLIDKRNENIKGSYSMTHADMCSEQSLKHHIYEIHNGTTKINYFKSNDMAGLWKIFQSMFKIIEAGGGFVKSKKGKYLFIFRNGKWDLPKGKREKNETIETCALREVEEECGIKGLKIVKRLPTTYHIYTLKDKQILKPTVWFEMECDVTSELIPQTEEGITEVKWFTKTDLKIVKRNTYPSIKDVISEIGK